MTTLTDRYVFAAVQAIPEDRRGDIDRELRDSITDAVDARIDAGQTPAEAETAVLTEFGDPRRLAASYDERPLYLIGPDLYLAWLRLLKTLLWIVGAGSFVAVLVVRMILEPSDPFAAFSGALGTCVELMIQVAVWVTIVFAVLQRTGARREAGGPSRWTPASLPPIGGRNQVSLGDTITTVVFLAFFIGVLLWQRVGSLLYLGGEPVLVLQEEQLADFWLPYLIGVLVLEAAFAVVLYAVGRWTTTLAAVNAAVALLFMLPALWLLATDRVFDWTFLANAGWASGTADWITGITAATTLVIGLVGIVSGVRNARMPGGAQTGRRASPLEAKRG